VYLFVDLLVVSEGVAIRLCDPVTRALGSWIHSERRASVGVSKPGGASVAVCCAITGCPIESMQQNKN
jgi:hypothetical protein